ncbi:pseudouridine synthase [Chytridium lagenaria]|nr:pseudouridine synthase [Chytridium lagenaria]
MLVIDLMVTDGKPGDPPKDSGDGTSKTESNEVKTGQKRGQNERKDKSNKRQKHDSGPRKSRKEEDGEGDENGNESGSKVPKRRVAVLLGYCGTGYQGMQMNVDCASIELELHKAFAASGVVSSANAMDPSKYCMKVGFARCARTDKGVHAAGQVVSLKMLMVDNPSEKINAALPEQIKVFDIVKVTNQFSPKNHCDSRMYEYILPTYVFKQDLFGDNPKATMEQLKEENKLASNSLKDVRHEYRIDDETLNRLRIILREYQGSYNYHNYTVDVEYKESSAKRYILSFEPFVEGDMEWLSLRVHGQSFMLHQIRKMVGMAILLMRTGSPPSFIQQTFKSTKLNVPKAPALGLFLRYPLFSAYNKKFGKLSNGGREDVDMSRYEDKVNPFVRTWIYDKIFAEEEKDHVFLNWLYYVTIHKNDFTWWLNEEGIIREDQKPVFHYRDGKELGDIMDIPKEKKGGDASKDEKVTENGDIPKDQDV